MEKEKKSPKDIDIMLEWVREAQLGSRDWRAESWRDAEFRDGAQWTEETYNDMIDAGIDPLVINRTFPVLSLIKGLHTINRNNIIAKGRTSKDTEDGKIFSECIAFALDQNEGDHNIDLAVDDMITAGVGLIGVSDNPDPRKESILVHYKDWTETWWDPFASPFLYSDQCRYMFNQPWVDLEDLQALFPKKRQEISDMYAEMCGTVKSDYGNLYYDDEGWLIEDKKRLYGLGWVNSTRRRVRPVQMYYPVFDDCWFAVFPDGQAHELKDGMDMREQYAMISGSQGVVQATVRKMWTCLFIGDLILQHMPTPYAHDEYPYAPFVCYLDRWKQPFGVPRQIRGQNEEVNKRRSMLMALLRKRRTIIESDAVAEDKLQTVHDEVNRIDGFVVLNPGGGSKIKTEQDLANMEWQAKLLEISEREIQEISGANNEQMGYQSNATSGVAMERRQQQASTMTNPIMENRRYGQKRLGELIRAQVQGRWTKEKVLRITDSMTGAERFLVLNQRLMTKDGMIIKYNVTQGRYDIIVSESPKTDTIREQNLNLLIEWMKRCPPEVTPQIFMLALEISDLPNKEVILTKMRPLFGMKPGEEDMSPEQVKQQAIQELEAQQKGKEREQQTQDQQIQLEMARMMAENENIAAKTREIMAKIESMKAKDKITGFKAGADVQARKEDQQQRENARRENAAAEGFVKTKDQIPERKPGQ